MRRAALCLALLAWLAEPAGGQASLGSPGAGMLRADPEALERALGESGVEREPVPPGASYLRELSSRITSAVMAALLQSGIRVSREVLVAVSGTIVAVALALLLWAAVTRLRRRRRAPGGATPGSVTAVAPAAAGDQGWDAAAWRAELDRRLAAGRVAEALEAAWWWLARALAGDRAEPTWTSRDLVRFARRDDLADPVRRLDAMAFGPARPSAEELRRLVGRLEATLP